MTEHESNLAKGRQYLRLLRRSLIRLRAITSDLIEPHGLTSQQFLALLTIHGKDGITQVELATELDSDGNTVSAMIGRLDKRRLLDRRKHEKDGRASRLHLTQAGRDLVDETLPDIDRLSLHLADIVAPEDVPAIERLLTAVSTLRTVP